MKIEKILKANLPSISEDAIFFTENGEMWCTNNEGKPTQLFDKLGRRIILHKDKTVLTLDDLTGCDTLHIGYSSSGDKIIGDGGEIFTNSVSLLGWEEKK